nr:hypothetical protein Itr_chr14CG12990 [Ipomoea trifida]GLL46601.1 hypothetical protein Itr_chr14CG13000 [Ipomoea trifida]GLL46603.1 hypothetical protein Itr_chr14CG13020 [Ipomoea trifida]GLL46605.1 hypothetical protein Itr_chr14CG13040 [Ipomoea trifida]GLL46606.1 hypothetical protein Itr_chr14CG13050 [Ipomoea trifida]
MLEMPEKKNARDREMRRSPAFADHCAKRDNDRLPSWPSSYNLAVTISHCCLLPQPPVARNDDHRSITLRRGRQTGKAMRESTKFV